MEHLLLVDRGGNRRDDLEGLIEFLFLFFKKNSFLTFVMTEN